jgi:hypothetical protein
VERREGRRDAVRDSHTLDTMNAVAGGGGDMGIRMCGGLECSSSPASGN